MTITFGKFGIWGDVPADGDVVPFTHFDPVKGDALRSNKAHHYISAVYMEGFTDERGRVHVYRSEKPDDPHPSQPRAVGYENYYYSQKLPDGGQENHRFEDLWHTIETAWPATVAALETRRESPAISMNTLGMMSIMRVRVPAARDARAILMEAGLRTEMRELERIGKVPESGDVMHMQDESFSELLNEINSKASQTRMAAALAWTAVVVGALVGLATAGPGFLLCILALPGWAIGNWFDSYRRTTVLYYDLEGDAETAYSRLAQGFDGLDACAAKWHIEAGGAIQSLTAWKRNSGASHLVNRKATTLAYKLPAVIKSNVTPPALHVGKQVMFFMPDIVLVQDGSRIGAVNYADLNVRWQDSRFIETERVPSDAKIVDHTWKHPNKSGGPDRRFKDNRQIPICLYEAMHFTSSTGVNELVEFSRTGVVAAFVDGCRMLAGLPRGRTTPAPALPPAPAGDAVDALPAPSSGQKRNRLKVAMAIAVGILVGIPVLAVVLGSTTKVTDTALPPALVAEISGTLSAGDKDRRRKTRPDRASRCSR